jgi:hypothetical protein
MSSDCAFYLTNSIEQAVTRVLYVYPRLTALDVDPIIILVFSILQCSMETTRHTIHQPASPMNGSKVQVGLASPGPEVDPQYANHRVR